MTDHDPAHAKIASNLRKWFSFGALNPSHGMAYPPLMTPLLPFSQFHFLGVKASGRPAVDSKFWANPLESTLPKAPDMKIYCLYGIGKATERSYLYRDQQDDPSRQYALSSPLNIYHNLLGADSVWSSRSRSLSGVRYALDTALGRNGVRYGDGDGSVPLVSLGYMCEGGWKSPLLNPSGAKAYTREYRHSPTLFDLRGGEETADHVDIMGNHDLLMDVLAIVAGSSEVDRSVILSELPTLTKEVNARLGIHTKP